MTLDLSKIKAQVETVFPCRCHEAYVGRNLIDSDCPFHNYAEEVLEILNPLAEEVERLRAFLIEIPSEEWIRLASVDDLREGLLTARWNWLERNAEVARLQRIADENYSDLLDQMDEAWGASPGLAISRSEINAFLESRIVHRPASRLHARNAKLEAVADLLRRMPKKSDGDALAIAWLKERSSILAVLDEKQD